MNVIIIRHNNKNKLYKRYFLFFGKEKRGPIKSGEVRQILKVIGPRVRQDFFVFPIGCINTIFNIQNIQKNSNSDNIFTDSLYFTKKVMFH